MRRGRRTRDQRLDPAETRRVDRDSHAVDKTPSRIEAAFEFETHDAAEPVEQFTGAKMVRMAFQAGIIDPDDCAMLLEPSRNLERTFVLMADSHRKCLHPAMKQKARVRIE